MSYDLFFRYRSDAAPKIDVPRFGAWFGGRAFYSMHEEGARAWYENDDTGVYFSFDHRDPGEVSFNINYCRPHVFGLEAEEELTDFVREHDLLVSDPQSEGMGDGEYSSDGFLRGWNAGNTWSVGMIEHEVPTLPAATIEAAWRWNRLRNVYQEHFAEIALKSCFVPKIIAIDDGSGRACTAAVWGQGMGVALPDVDGVLVVPESRKGGLRWLPAEEVSRVIGPQPVQPAGHSFEHFDGERFEVPFAARVLTWERPPKELVELLEGAGEPFRGRALHWGDVLDAELVKKK